MPLLTRRPEPSAKFRPKTNGGYLFLPRRWSRGAFLKWLRRTHAWVGLWGASLGLLFGSSGILLNHRELMKIPAARIERTEVQLLLPEPHPDDPGTLAAWLGKELQLATDDAKIERESAKTVVWNGMALQQPSRWQISLRNPRETIQAEYWQGNHFVTLKRGQGNWFSVLVNLHKGSGMSAGWVLLADTLAGGLIILSLTGILLWTRLHGNRLAAAGLGLGSLGIALGLAWQALGG